MLNDLSDTDSHHSLDMYEVHGSQVQALNRSMSQKINVRCRDDLSKSQSILMASD